MTDMEKRTFSLSTQQAGYIDSLVESGDYASASEVVREGLRSLQEREVIVERWLREEVVPAYDEIRAHPERGIPAEKVFAEIYARHDRLVKNSKKQKKRKK